MYIFKRNGSFSGGGTIRVSEYGNALQDLTGWTGKCEMRTAGGALIANLNFAWVNAAQRAYRLSVADATAWPLGIHNVDILLTSPPSAEFPTGADVPTGTWQIQVQEGITVA